MFNYILVAVGGALGSVARFWASGLVARYTGGVFPYGTLFVNVTGSFIIGFFATITSTEGRWLLSGAARNFFMTGVCGGYTTFSSFSLQTLNLVEEDEWLHAVANILGSVVLCLLAVVVGHFLAAKLNNAKAF